MNRRDQGASGQSGVPALLDHPAHSPVKRARPRVLLGAFALAAFMTAGGLPAKPPAHGGESVLLVVTDPLAKELACACVKGYAQRDYRKLSSRLQGALKQPVSIEFSDDLAESLASVRPDRQVIVVGDDSLVTFGARKAGIKFRALCELTDLDGAATLAALFVARSDDVATGLKEIGGRKVFFGVPEADRKRAAAMSALREVGLESGVQSENRGSYSDAALDLLDSTASPPPVAVIPSYALRLLEGCGSVKPGSLKVIGKTESVPFIRLFLSESIPAEKQEKILRALLSMRDDPKLLKAMESGEGFRPLKAEGSGGQSGVRPADWPDWRGPGRDGLVSRLPERLSAKPKFVWKKAAMTGALAGLSVGGHRLILAERDFSEEHDVYRCLNTEDGELIWLVQFPARGKLDYGQAPRATPVIHEGRVYLLGALGGLRCVSLENGKAIWERHLPSEFKTRLPTWGMCSTPLLVDDLLIVNPGATNASLAAVDCATGRTRWTTPGLPAAYSAFICGEFGRRRQIVGYDQHSLGGWDIATGHRLWQLVPPVDGDFNVPTPLAVDEGILLSTENNGTRLYSFDAAGRIIAKPAAVYADLSPTTATPVVTRGRLFGAQAGLHCLDLRDGLKPIWHGEEDGVGDHATLFADDQRVLVITLGGELILLDARADRCAVISRLRIFEDDVEVYAHPALVGSRLYARGGSSVVCVDLKPD